MYFVPWGTFCYIIQFFDRIVQTNYCKARAARRPLLLHFAIHVDGADPEAALMVEANC